MCSNLDDFFACDTEGVVVISLTEQPPEYTIQKILEVETLPNPLEDKDFIKGYEWTVDNKYYTATVVLYALPEKKVLDTKFCGTVRGTIFHFDGREASSFEEILSWMPFLKDFQSDIKLLVCDSWECDDSLKKKLLEWCIENEFELIELNPSEENEDENDRLFSKHKGYGRIIESLQTHMWSNLKMKEDNKDQKEQKREETDNTMHRTSPVLISYDVPKTMSVDGDELILEEQWVQKVFKGEDPEEESFEELFSKFASLKDKASNLSGEDRKKYAEKVAVAFWKAMGGDEDEIEGLDDE